ncbi:sortilin-related receptor-like isoform X5 [Diabrotica virgifera virgifera]|uniref:Sortilin-related receptor n=1 Tax=Diabrotica virgifera virgifera TaxID=50390 RepID=A0ABM5K1T5_DIAVI|nr:sortilin-related receptor-like isoform X5 [Diabrotica virgifera virgifera]
MYLLLFIPLFTKLTIGLDIQSKTLYGNIDDIGKSSKTNILDAPSDSAPYNGEIRRKRREVESSSSGVVTKANYLYVSQKQLMVHWVGENSKVIICLARDPASIVPDVPSAVFISYDDGDTYQNKTESFNLPDGGYATLERFYSHAKLGAHFVFTDIKHNAIYVTTDYGKTFERRDLNFTPSEISFHGLNPSIFVLLDKNTTKHKLWITEDSGKSFRMVEESVKAFYWLKEANDQYRLVVQRSEPNDLSTILLSMNLFKNRESQIYISNVTDFFIKGDYLFSTKYNEKGELQLYVSYKLGAQLLCIFDSKEKFKSYFIVDVTNTKALVAAGHSNTTSHLYVSESLAGNGKEVKFTLSLEDLFVFFPSTTWQDTWLHHKSEQAFADVYKVEGLTGIYIASRVTSKPVGAHLGPQHLGSVITFDHGTTWRLIQPPALNAEGQWSGCVTRRNCSLHLSQKFNQLLPDTRSVGILSSKSAPGFIMATGVLGENLKNQYGIYISSDGGVTWRQTLRELYFFNMGDHGGILSAAKYYKTNEETRHIEYSTDEGRSWYQTEFNNEKLRLYGLMTEPGKNTTLFTIFGSLPEYHQWIIVKVDFAKVFERKCTKDDYNMWSPSHSEDIRNYIPCEMGLQVAYQRRMPLAKCLNGLDYIQLKSTVVCECDLLDFECDSGFARVGSPPRCIRDKSSSLDVYRVPAPCKPGNFYNRTKGYRKIAADSCVGGFESHYLPDIVPCPFHEEDDFLLFAQRENIFKYNLIRNNLEQLAVPNLKNAVAIDFDIADNCVYWSDLTDKNIGRRCFVNGNATEILVSDDIISVEGIAFDWISKTLYFVDSVRAKIGLIRTNTNHNGRMRRTILNSTVLTKPRGIVVHPSQGYMFWTDWFPHAPSVNRANLDGSSNMTLFGRDKVQTPNGIAIDYFANRLYWIDAGLDYIGSSDLHGDGFVKVVSNTDVVSHPFAIAVFKDNLYWDDWRLHSIFSSDKENFNGAQVILKERKSLMGLKVVQHGIQIGTNACANTTCPYICVGLPKNRAACLCPDGLTMNNGKCVCPGNLEPLANFTCPSVAPTCAPSLFMCGDGRCLPNGFRCDGDFDCIDGSDEGNCPLPNCPEGSFQCENGRCIHSSWRCDGEHDCGDRSDEKNCTDGKPIICKFYEFHCNSGAVSCIPAVWRCDGEADCTDRSDESSCSNNTCNDSQFSCGIPSNRCISKNWVCDGEKDCIDGRDEANCTLNGRNETCLDWMFQCKDQHCIPFWWKCDGNNDCEDNSDEEGCSSPPNSPIDNTTSQRPLERCNGSNEYRCATGDCILASWVCDGQADCPDETDELSCDDKLPDGSGTPNCTFGMFPCNETCYPLSLVCDGKIDCKDGYDEKNCSTIGAAHPPIDNPTSHRPNATCESNEYQCNTGNCILTAWLCDGDADCIGGEDEKKCETSVNCSRSEFKCQIYGSCIPATAVCDGLVDCRDKTDELSCDDKLPDGSGTPSYPPIDNLTSQRPNVTCESNQYQCDRGNCILASWVCDGDVDCTGGEDEKDCDTSVNCSKSEFKCQTDGRCIPATAVCDGLVDCPDKTDELSCDDKLPDGSGTPSYPPIDNLTSQRPNVTCESNQYQCDRGNCILASWVCDGDVDCTGGEDEKDCDTSVNCSRSEFKCQTDGRCIPATAVCDGHVDCSDKTDELSCDDKFPDGFGAPNCTFGMFPCNETCYPVYLLCDGKIDCEDGYDEKNCSTKARVYQINKMEVDERFTNASTIYINWWIVRPTGLELEYQPSIKKIGDEHWRNESWIGQPYYQFTNLQPFTKYNMTVYVRIKNTHVVFPPAIYNVSSTSESIPSEPWNVSARQRNGSHILISWNKPRSPNGLIVSYELCWIYPNSAEIRLKLSGNETSHMLSQDFDNGLNYTFWVIARNRKFESKKSLPATLMFDGTSNIEGVKNIKVKEEDDTISLTWDYSKEVEGFDVRVFTDRPYPNLPPRTTSTKNITLKLAPGVNYKVGINAFKKDLVGPTSYISFRRAGNSLPEIESLQVIVLKDIGTAVKLRWDRPKYAKKLNWMYGVYYGINHQQLFESARNTTINESITITNLDSCENYVFSVGLVGPIGFGPLSGNIQQVSTSENPRAPPKRLIVEEDGNDPLQMKISWIPPCPSRQPVFYKLLITEKSTTQTYFRKADGSHANSYVFKVLHGGIYEVKVATDEPNAIYSKAVKYFAPAISPPVELRVGAINNGSYVVDWKDEDLPQNIGKYRYEVFVHDGNKLNESSAQKFIVDGPPFVYTNASAKMYTFAVRIKTSKGLNSQMSHSLSLENLNVQAPQNMTAVIVPSVLVIIALLAVVAFLVVRNKKIQNSFTRFTNSHYDTRSEAATFDDNNLEEDDSPHIRGFADDEPLVLA